MGRPKGLKHSEESKRKISETMKRKVQSGEIKPHLASPKGGKRSEETKQKIRAKALETRRKDRLRVKWGMAQKTKLKLFSDPRRAKRRYNFKKKGYIVDYDGTELYYDENTKRCELMEQRAPGYGFTILPIAQRKTI